ncbi:HD-GYP domain-containing protein [Paenibacillus koleovorans]|uniref:HD-GYP domain-containing protein n=1 Tax=Paenibacillus koleovorans TaxID=121608 RepID=UPI000FDC4B14|nr:HD-GYP domain-containing protein [Paenibacillus koleovorans]
MRLIPIGACMPGMRLAKNIHNEEGLVLLAERVELTEAIIRKLGLHGVSFLYIEDKRTEDIVIADVIRAETRQRAMKEIRTEFRRLMTDAMPRKAINAPFFGKAFKQIISMIVDDLKDNENAMILLAEISITDHYLYQHSLSVCLYSLLMGVAQGYDQNELMTLGLGALLHDIGKTRIPTDILFKKGPLDSNELQAMRSHPELGFRMLKDEPNIPLLSAHCALQHHERIDGSGYPRGIKGSNVHSYAQWIGILDSYDAMTSYRVYRDTALLPHQAMEELFAGAGTQYDKMKVELFRDRVALYPLGLQVKLSTGEAGVVVDLNSRFSQRPVVRVLQDPIGGEVSQPYEIDLSKNLSVMIIAVHPFD